MTCEAFPLSWPAMYPRTPVGERRRARFEPKGFDATRLELMLELKRLGAEDVVLSTNLPLRNDGMPRAGAKLAGNDPGVAIYFKWRGQPRSLACDHWDRVEDNLHAIELTIEAMRGIARWKASDILNRAFMGLTALPAPEQWWDVLGVKPEAPVEVCEIQYRVMIQKAHPDRGGSEGKAASLNWAIGEARRAKEAP